MEHYSQITKEMIEKQLERLHYHLGEKGKLGDEEIKILKAKLDDWSFEDIKLAIDDCILFLKKNSQTTVHKILDVMKKRTVSALVNRAFEKSPIVKDDCPRCMGDGIFLVIGLGNNPYLEKDMRYGFGCNKCESPRPKDARPWDERFVAYGTPIETHHARAVMDKFGLGLDQVIESYKTGGLRQLRQDSDKNKEWTQI